VTTYYEAAGAGEPTTSTTARQSVGRMSQRTLGRAVVSWITSTDHKVIGYMYLITSFFWFLVAGVMALIIRAELFEPGIQIVQNKEQYNQLFTMHGTIMLLISRRRCSPASPTR